MTSSNGGVSVENAKVRDRELGPEAVERTEVAGGVAGALDVVEPDVRDVELVVLEAGQRGAPRECVQHLGEWRLSEVVARVGLEDDALAEAPLLKLVRPGAVGLAGPVAGVRLDLLLVDHESGRVRELREEEGLRGVEREADGAVVDHLEAGDIVREPGDMLAHADDVAEVGAGDRGLQLARGRAVNRVLDVPGGHRTARVEERILAQRKRVDGTAARDLDVLGEVEHDLEVGRDRDEAGVDLDDVLGGQRVGREVRIERHRIA